MGIITQNSFIEASNLGGSIDANCQAYLTASGIPVVEYGAYDNLFKRLKANGVYDSIIQLVAFNTSASGFGANLVNPTGIKATHGKNGSGQTPSGYKAEGYIDSYIDTKIDTSTLDPNNFGILAFQSKQDFGLYNQVMMGVGDGTRTLNLTRHPYYYSFSYGNGSFDLTSRTISKASFPLGCYILNVNEGKATGLQNGIGHTIEVLNNVLPEGVIKGGTDGVTNPDRGTTIAMTGVFTNLPQNKVSVLEDCILMWGKEVGICKKIGRYIGDSITYAHTGWVDFVSNLKYGVNVDTFNGGIHGYKQGLSGGKMLDLYNVFQNPSPTGGTTDFSQVMYNKLFGQTFIALGINDMLVGDNDAAAFKTRLKYVVNFMVDNLFYPKSEIVLLTVYFMSPIDGRYQDDKFMAYVNACKEASAELGVQCLDVYTPMKYAVDKANFGFVAPNDWLDGLHPKTIYNPNSYDPMDQTAPGEVGGHLKLGNIVMALLDNVNIPLTIDVIEPPITPTTPSTGIKASRRFKIG